MPMAMAKRQVVSRGSVSSCPGCVGHSREREKPKEVEEDYTPRGLFVPQRVEFWGAKTLPPQKRDR